MKKRVLITSIGGMFSHDLIRALRMTKNIFLLGTDIRKTSNAYFLDKFEQIPDPAKGSKKYIQKIIYLCKKYNINFIIPCSENECIEISRYYEKLLKLNIYTSVSRFDVTKTLIDKHKLFTVLKKNFIDVGKWYPIDNFKNLEDEDVTIIDSIKSKYQTIDLVRDDESVSDASEDEEDVYCLVLNNEIQNTSEEANSSHDIMINLTLKLCNRKKIKDILILGGGDGYPAKVALTHKNLNITNVEIDDALVDFVKNNEYTKKLTNDAFNNKRVNLVTKDAYDYVYTDNNKYDIIINDIELKTNQNYTTFEDKDMYIFETLLKEYGVLNCTCYIYDDNINKLANILLNMDNKKKYNVLLFTTEEDFNYINNCFYIDANKVKKNYRNSEIGVTIKENEDIGCGSLDYEEELFFFISKNEFNKNSPDINFVNFSNI